MVERIQISQDSFIRFVLKDGDPWFVTSDICQIIGGDTSSLRKTINTLFFPKKKYQISLVKEWLL
jgi:prophage antirepressor-like protein